MAGALDKLAAAADELATGLGREEIVADGIRDALNQLDQLVGRVDVEHLLDEIFLSFCLGK